MQEKKVKNSETKNLSPEEFSSNLEKGDLGISKLIDWGYILYGQTRTGKTATGHYLSGYPLRGFRKDGQDMVDLVTSKNNKAKIGNNRNSETTIPNFFQVLAKDAKHLKGKAYIVDTPGYGDTSGILKILSNGYYHYRLYSKVKNMKFILCFDQSHLTSSPRAIIQTIIEFTSSFKDYLNKKEEIWESCAFLITKVDEEQNSLDKSIQNLESLYKLQIEKNQRVVSAIKDFIKFIIKEKRIFYFNKIQQGKIATSGDLLQQIDKKISRWWSRNMNQDNQKNEVNMDKVQFSLTQKIIETCNQKESKKNFSQLVRYYNNHIKQFLKYRSDENTMIEEKNSLFFVLNQLANDAMKEPSSKNFLEVMESYVKKYSSKFDPNYREEREIKEKQLFAREESESLKEKKSSKKPIIKDKNYTIKKFNALRKIQKLKFEINYQEINYQQKGMENEILGRSLKLLEKYAKNLYSIIRQFNKVSYTKNNSIKIIYKFGYLIYRIVEESKMFLLLIELSSTPELKQKINQISNNEFIDLMRPLRDFMGLSYFYKDKQYTSEKLQQEYVRNFDLTDLQYQKLNINEDFVNFFTGIKIPDITDSQKTKIFNLVLKYSDKILTESPDQLSLGNSATNKLLLALSNARMESDPIYFGNRQNDQKKKNDFLFIRKITINLGKVLEHLGEYQLARRVFETINFVFYVGKLYELEIGVLDSQKNKDGYKKSFNLRMKYCNYLAAHLKEQEAIGLLQQMFELAEDYIDIQLVGKQIIELKANDNSIRTDYEQNLSAREYLTVYNDKLAKEINTIAQPLSKIAKK